MIFPIPIAIGIAIEVVIEVKIDSDSDTNDPNYQEAPEDKCTWSGFFLASLSVQWFNYSG